MSSLRRFIQCDVFSPTATLGNALAVVVDGEGLSDEQMQNFAAWTNLAETTFMLPAQQPIADYRLRIFTPTREMKFAGHPTLGSCAAWLHCGGQPKDPALIRQECAIGIVEIDARDRQCLAFVAPPTQINAMKDENFSAIVDTLDIPPDQILASAELDNGPVFQVFHLNSADAVLRLDSSAVRWPQFKAIGVIGAHPVGSECDYEVRMLAPSSGMSEDPITGSLNSALAHWLQVRGELIDSVMIAQGTQIGRQGRVSVSTMADSNGLTIGGQTHVLVEGTLNF
ncbi:MAG: PhzF family phenazine biosynthesis protein [Gammaproteobacteria bacterium]|jgi:PhzF family phenazine biosynthesis protein